MRPPTRRWSGPSGSRVQLARALAREVHAAQIDRYGEPVLTHVERVADSVNASAKPVAYVHDVCERSRHTPLEVSHRVGLDPDERHALELLTKQADESVVDHTRRILDSDAVVARDLAIRVKRADVADHLAQPGHDPRYREVAAILADGY